VEGVEGVGCSSTGFISTLWMFILKHLRLMNADELYCIVLYVLTVSREVENVERSQLCNILPNIATGSGTQPLPLP
jgi:hypothetical protein